MIRSSILYIYISCHIICYVTPSYSQNANELNEREQKKRCYVAEKNKKNIIIQIIINPKKIDSMSVLETIANPVGSIIGAGINAFTQNKANRQNRHFSREMFDKTNAYNTPAMQVKRMKEAGLNPALMYQGAPQNTAQQGHQANAEAYRIPENLLGEAFKTLAETKKIQGDTVTPTVTINNVMADTAQKLQGTETSNQLAIKAATEAQRVQQQYDMERELWTTSQSFRKAQALKMALDAQKTENSSNNHFELQVGN